MFERAGKSPGIWDPRTSKLLHIWDSVMGVALVLTAILTPFEIAFVPDGSVGVFGRAVTRGPSYAADPGGEKSEERPPHGQIIRNGDTRGF